jgi:hypothetical protein
MRRSSCDLVSCDAFEEEQSSNEFKDVGGVVQRLEASLDDWRRVVGGISVQSHFACLEMFFENDGCF